LWLLAAVLVVLTTAVAAVLVACYQALHWSLTPIQLMLLPLGLAV
jgi:hypothetical protein